MTDFNSEKPRKASDSLSFMSEIILPNDTNTHGNLMGGKLMYWMDIAAVIAAQKHCQSQVVTASVDNISFNNPVKLGNVVTIEAQVTRSFHSSMEIFIRVWANDLPQGEKYLTNEAYLTLVALNSLGKPKEVPAVLAETEEEKEQYEGALRRRQLRLVLAGKIKPNEATELKALFQL